MNELPQGIWKEVAGYEGKYFVNDCGQVWTVHQSRLLKGYDMQGYRCYRLSKNGRENTLRAHRLVGAAFIPNPLNKPCINHINSVRDDNRIANLEWVTLSENGLHADRMGRLKYKFGENCNLSKYSDEFVRQILELNKTVSQAEIGRRFNIPVNTIYSFHKRRRPANTQHKPKFNPLSTTEERSV